LPFWNAVVLKGWTVVLMIDMVPSFLEGWRQTELTGAILGAPHHSVV
jgi:hypothetical protein